MLTQAAMSYHRAGLCVLPAKRAEKRPAVGAWKRYRQTRPTEAELSAWMANPRNKPDAICIVCGAVSGNAEIIDFDAGGELFPAWWEQLPVELRERLVIETTPSGGFHVIYRCQAPVCGNLKLAQRKVGDRITTLIETRGEGGLFLCAPTMGYILGHGDLADPPVLTVAQRDTLLQAAWDLNEYLPSVIDGLTDGRNVGQRGAMSVGQPGCLAENPQMRDCPSHNGAVGPRGALSVEQGACAAENTHARECRSHNGAVGQRGAISAEQCGCGADITNNGGCRPHNDAVGQTTAVSVKQRACGADISNNGGSRPESAHISDCSSDNGPGGPMSVDISHIAGLSADDADIEPDAADRSHIGQCASHSAHARPMSADNADRPGDDFNTRGDPRPLLQQHGWIRIKTGDNEYWRRPGKDSGTSATLKDRVFYVFSSNAAPFEPNRGYSPFAVYALLNHGGDFEEAARSLRMSGYGGQPGHCSTHSADGVDISAMIGVIGHSTADTANINAGASHSADIRAGASDNADIAENAADGPDIADPGPMSTDMLRVPGFVSEVMDHCLATAPYPNQVMAFAGALSLMAFLAGRKVRDSGDNRTNIYLLGLAHSASGKDWPRKINTRILNEIGLADALGERFASGEGIQDALFQTPSMLFQTDEIDGMLQSINKAKDARHEAVMSTLLTMFSSSNSVFPMRRKAGIPSPGKAPGPGVIDQPSLVIFGTAIPNHYYEALSERMLTNGFFARMIILEAGQRGTGQEPSICDLPKRVMDTASWWSKFHPGDHRANLVEVHPVPAIVSYTDQARRLLIETRKEAEAQYALAESKSDAVGTTVWGRVSEQTRKLALLYAISENHVSPSIGIEAVRWASQFVMHQTRRMLFMAAGHVAENPFHAECLKLTRKLRDSPDRQMTRNNLMRAMRCKQADFDQILGTLMTQGDIIPMEIPTKTKPAQGYRLP